MSIVEERDCSPLGQFSRLSKFSAAHDFGRANPRARLTSDLVAACVNDLLHPLGNGKGLHSCASPGARWSQPLVVAFQVLAGPRRRREEHMKLGVWARLHRARPRGCSPTAAACAGSRGRGLLSRTRRARPNGTPVQVRSEDFASILLRFDTGARGAFIVSQVSAGRKNRLELAIDGGRGALEWNSEDSERLWLGSRGSPSQLAQRDPAASLVPGISTLPAGHAEGWYDALRTTIAGFYEMVRGGGRAAPWVASWEDGLREVALTKAILASSNEQRWVGPALARI